MSDALFFVAKDNTQLPGNHRADEIVTMMRQSPSAVFQVWKEGMASWADPSQVPEIAELLASAPAAQVPPDLSGLAAPPVNPAPKASAVVGSAVQELGFVRSLFDFKFSSFVTPKVIRAFYILGFILAVLGAIGALVSGVGSLVAGIRYSRWGIAFLGLVWLLLSPVIFIVELAFVRMFLEVVMVLFKVKEDLDILAGK